MINKSTPYYIDNNSDAWKWKIAVPYKFPKIIDIPEKLCNVRPFPRKVMTLHNCSVDSQGFSFMKGGKFTPARKTLISSLKSKAVWHGYRPTLT